MTLVALLSYLAAFLIREKQKVGVGDVQASAVELSATQS